MSFRLPRFLLRRTHGGPAHPQSLELSGGPVAVSVRAHPRARRLILRLAPDRAGVVVTVPEGIDPRSVSDFLQRHRGWIEARLQRREGEAVRVEAGATIPFRGASLRLVTDPAPRTLRLVEDTEGPRLLVGGEPARFARRVSDFLKREARADLQAAVDRHASAVGLRPASLTLKDTRSRWGSCTQDRRLAFSWRIAMAPPEVLDYLAAHEVAHFREMNHGPRFWALCRTLCPDMEKGRAWLKRHGASLHAVDFGTGTPGGAPSLDAD